MKRIVSMIAAVLMGVVMLSACNKKGDGEIVTPVDKKELMFQIDEGIAGKELMSVYKDDSAALNTALGNIYAGIAPLKEKYEVSVLISPIWVYSETGYAGGGSASVGANRIHPAMKTTLDYLAQKGIEVYIEMYSSDIYTNQNGELGRLPIVKERYGSSREIKGLAIDLDCLEDLFDKYPVIKGIRYHELIGTHWIQDNGHGFKVEMDVVRTMADICKSHDKRLVWGDHMWDNIFADKEFEFWQSHLNYACDLLGDKLTLDFNNNSWAIESSIQYKRTMADYRNGNKWGYSVQSWFWQEKDANCLSGWPEKSPPTRWYADAFLDMPVELMAAFTLETFRRGGSLVQFEPPMYWFNYPLPNPGQTDFYIGMYEKDPDYSARLNLKRFVDIMLDYPDNPGKYPSMVPVDYYPTDGKKMRRNLWSERPKTYYQTTMGVMGADGVRVYDTYIANPGKWYENSANRYREWVLDGEVVDMQRNDNDFRQIDEYIVVKKKERGREAQFYNHMSAYYTNCDNIVADNNNGAYLGFTSLNLKRNYGMPLNGVQTQRFFGDPDEIITARNNKGKVHFTVYEKLDKPGNNPVRTDFVYTEDAALTAALNARYDVGAEDYVAILGHRSMNVLYADNTKSLDNILLVTKNSTGKLDIKGTLNLGSTKIDISRTLNVAASNVRDIKCGDYDSDYMDDIFVLTDSGAIKIFGFDALDGYKIFERAFEQNFAGAKFLYTLRWTNYFNG